MPEEATAVSGPVILKNRTCAYCGREFGPDGPVATKEHVIGRRFVPLGTLNNVFNLILQACNECNNIKSDLEDEIAAASMMPNAAGQFPEESGERLAAESQRKRENSISRFTHRAMKDSLHQMHLNTSFGAMNMEFKFTGPPVVEHGRLCELARLQIVAFMYWLTYQESEQRGRFIIGEFHTANIATRNDWGNAVQRSFMVLSREWKDRLVGDIAQGHFRVAIRRSPGKSIWSWALEWNMNYRLIGLLGSPEEILTVVEDLPQLEMREVSRSESEVLRMRTEAPLEPGDDELFT